ncbi:hypothetical protein HBI59_209020 [Parastagonospora nodorum]|nr:hypothetical protein HBI59_209020 [Parastagonospora nodorum]
MMNENDSMRRSLSNCILLHVVCYTIKYTRSCLPMIFEDGMHHGRKSRRILQHQTFYTLSRKNARLLSACPPLPIILPPSVCRSRYVLTPRLGAFLNAGICK